VDALDLFTPGGRPTTFRASLWLYGSTQGVVALAGAHESVEAAEAVLAARTGIELTLHREVIEDGIDQLAARMYEAGDSLAVVIRIETGDVHSQAPLPRGWVPDDHPARMKETTAL